MTDLQKLAIATVHKYWDMGNRLYGMSLPYPTISFRLRGATAGNATVSTMLIKLNPQLLEANGKDFIDRTPGHEVAHIFAFKKFGIQRTPRGRMERHGWAWQEVMRDFGLDSSRCHSFDTSFCRQARSRADRPYVYACGCRQFRFTSIRHRRVLNGAIYHCKACRGDLRFVEIAA